MHTLIYNLQDYVNAGGMVMLPLVLVSVAMWVLIAERVIFFRRLHRRNMSSHTAWEHIREGRMPDPRQYRGIVSLLVTEFLGHRNGTDRCLDRAMLEEIVLRLQRSMQVRLSLIGVLAAVAPLLGLLGTVTGMIATFDVLAFFGTGNARAMAAGISEALITTQTGLMVAIPGLYMKGFLDRRAENLSRRITRVGYYLGRQMGAV